jgi:hypothetical protein
MKQSAERRNGLFMIIILLAMLIIMFAANRDAERREREERYRVPRSEAMIPAPPRPVVSVDGTVPPEENFALLGF